MTDAELLDLAWSSGHLEHLMMPTQRRASKWWDGLSTRKGVLLCNRRWGKSFWLCLKAIETCLRIAGAVVHYGAPTAKQVRGIIEPSMKKILVTCPKRLMPEYRRQDGIYVFPQAAGGGEIHIAGTDNQGADRLRGASTNLGVVDEAGMCQDLRYLVQDVLLPQTITTGGRILLASTPALSAAHDLHQYYMEAQENGSLLEQTIHDCDHIGPALIQEYIQESGGEHTSTWKREYLGMWVVDDDLAVVPEFDPAFNVLDRELPSEYHAYVAMDVGYSDLTVAVLAVHDFLNDMIYVVDERVFRNMPSTTIERGVMAMEEEWLGKVEPRRRVVDAPPIVIADIRNTANRSWQAARKDDADAALNALRLAVQRGTLRVHPRCKTVIAHLEHGIWNASKTSFDRSDPQYGHFDAIDACKYLVRHVDRHENPFPKPEIDRENQVVARAAPQDDAGIENLFRTRYDRKSCP